MMYGGNMFGMGWMWIFWILLVLGTALLVFVLVKLATRNDAPRPPDGTSRARTILEERFARGEINADEFRERLRTLEEGKP